MNKKGLNQAVSLILIILVAIVAIVIIWNVIRAFTESSSSSIDSGIFSTSLSIPSENVVVNNVSKTVEFNVERNAGGSEIAALSIILEDPNGETCITEEDYRSTGFTELSSKRVIIKYSTNPDPDTKCPDIQSITKISIAPIIKTQDGKEKTAPVADTYKISDSGSTTSSSGCTTGSCDDGISCTQDSCNVVTGSCEYLPDDVPCDDGLSCNGIETCDATLDCQAGTAQPDGSTCGTGGTCQSGICTQPTQSIGEAGTITLSTLSGQRINFQGTYTSTPIIIATPVTENNNDNYPIPVIQSIDNTGFTLGVCLDSGLTTCEDPAPNTETFHYFVFDVDKVAPLSWIDVGTIDVATDGSTTPLTFSKTFTNIPDVWTTSQSSNQGSNIAAIAWVNDIGKTTTNANLIGCIHQGTANACTSGLLTESMGYVAIDTVLAQISGLQSGLQSISNSLWTPVIFSPPYTSPRIMATQNDDSGGQDPQYPWARNVLSSGADIRYCEQDGPSRCDGHSQEKVYWFALEDGPITLQ